MSRARHGNSGTHIILIGAIVFLILLVTALGFVIVLKPADNEYNNTIPAFMGVLSIVSTAVSALVLMLKQNQQHLENKAKIDEVTQKLEGDPL